MESLTPVFSRVHIPAFDFSTAFNKLEVHGETVFRFVSANGRDSRFQWIGGVIFALRRKTLSSGKAL